ncbi:MAG: exo-alpha-sialidase [Gammaproteobacteria bacterium]|nr:exo-alpha-sialidase [Gammaproteobacteria bacterium]
MKRTVRLTRPRRTGLVAVALGVGLATSACNPFGGEPTEHPDWHEPLQVARGEAHAGEWRMNDSDFRYVDDPTIALAPNGDAGIAWVDQARQSLFFRRYDADGTARGDAPVEVPSEPGIFSWLPRMVFTDDGTIHVLWQEIIFSGGFHGGEIMHSRSTDGGASFSEPTNLSNTTNGAGKGRWSVRVWYNGSLDLAAVSDDTLYAVWTEYQGTLLVARSTDAGVSWSEPATVFGGEDELPARGPSLSAGPDGVIHLAWSVGGADDADIHYARSIDRGATFRPSTTVHPGDSRADAPEIAVAADGTIHLTWTERRENPTHAYRVLHASRAPGATEFGAPRIVSDPLPAGFAGARYPYLELDGDGRPHILFELYRDEASYSQGLAIVRSLPGGAFSAPERIPRGRTVRRAINGSLQGMFMDKLATTPDGRHFIVNSTFLEGERSAIWLLRSR